MVAGFKADPWLKTTVLFGIKENSVALRPSRPNPAVMVGSVHFPKEMPAGTEAGGGAGAEEGAVDLAGLHCLFPPAAGVVVEAGAEAGAGAGATPGFTTAAK